MKIMLILDPKEMSTSKAYLTQQIFHKDCPIGRYMRAKVDFQQESKATERRRNQ